MSVPSVAPVPDAPVPVVPFVPVVPAVGWSAFHCSRMAGKSTLNELMPVLSSPVGSSFVPSTVTVTPPGFEVTILNVPVTSNSFLAGPSTVPPEVMLPSS